MLAGDTPVHSLFLPVLENAPPALVVDCGANLGYFSLLAASRGHFVAAFEPLSVNLARFSASVERNGWADRVALYHNALSFRHENVSVRATDVRVNIGNGRVQKGALDRTSTSQSIYGVDYVETVRLDDVVPEIMRKGLPSADGSGSNGAASLGGFDRIKLIKIDVVRARAHH